MEIACKLCTTRVKRTRAEPRKGGGFNYADSEGRFWKGLVCPDCKFKKLQAYNVVSAANKRTRGEADDTENHGYPIKQPQRYCRACGGNLPQHLYFRHETCVPEGINFNEFYEVHTSRYNHAS